MGVRAFRAKIECDPTTLKLLWRTHCVYNKRLLVAIDYLFRMRRGECGATDSERALYKQIAEFIIAAPAKSNFDYLMNSVSLPSWKCNSAKKIKCKVVRDGEIEVVSGESWADQAAELLAKGVLLYNKKKVYGDLPLSISAVVIRDAVAAISSYDALTKIWESERLDWEKAKAEWERQHPGYMALRPRFAEGEKVRGGRFAKRAERDHAYLAWLQANPDLAAWRRQGEPVVVPLDDAAQERVAKAKPWKQATKRAEEFWRLNPELFELHKTHIAYERQFVRRRKSKRNQWREGFKQRPTFTAPSPVLHPRWTQFNAPQTSPNGYKDLVLPDRPKNLGLLKLCLITGNAVEGKMPTGWVELQFRPDPRMTRFRVEMTTRTKTKGKEKGITVEVPKYRFLDEQLGIQRKAEISGVKLIFRNVQLHDDSSQPIEERLKEAKAYLTFTVNVQDEPLTERAKAIKFADTGEVTKSGKPRKLPAGLVSVAVDLDARGIGFLTRVISGLPESEWTHDGVKVIQSRNLVVQDKDGGAGPTLEHIRDHKRDIARARRLRGKPVKGEQSHSRLQNHITNMGEDRFKKAARKIVNEAFRGFNRASGELYPRADVLLMEDLKWFNPDATRERGINKMLARWNRANLMGFIDQFAKDAGIRHGKAERVSAWGTSQVCSKCGAVGKRYRIEADPEDGRPVIRFARGNEPLPLFACPNLQCRGRSNRAPRSKAQCTCAHNAPLLCDAHPPFTCNADHNASINLHRRYAMGEKAVATFLALGCDLERRRQIEEIEATLLPALKKLHRLA